MLSERPWGIARVVLSLAKSQSNYAEVIVAANQDLAHQLDIDPEVRFLPLPITFGGSWPSAGTMLRMIRNFILAGRMLDSIQADIIHFHLPSALAIALLCNANTRKVYTVHGEFFENRFIRKFQWILMPLLIGRKVVTTISKYALRPRWLLGRTKVIPNGIDSTRVKLLARDNSGIVLQHLTRLRDEQIWPIISFPGIIISRKGQELAVRSMRGILQEFPNAVMVFIGEGPDRSRLVKLSGQLGVEKRTMFLGFVRNQYPILQNSDLILSHLTRDWPLPSLVELEGVCLGKPVLTLYTDEKFLLYHNSVFYITSETIQELVVGIRNALRSTPKSVVANSSALKMFDWEVISSKYRAVYLSKGGLHDF